MSKLCAMKPPRQKKSDITKACLDLARHLGWECVRMQSGVARGPKAGWITLGKKGRTDWLLVRRAEPGSGDIFYLEFERPGEVPEPHQLVAHAELRHRGFLVAVMDDAIELSTWLSTNWPHSQ
jgi:hypothetical protein